MLIKFSLCSREQPDSLQEMVQDSNPNIGRQNQRAFCEFDANLVYVVSSMSGSNI